MFFENHHTVVERLFWPDALRVAACFAVVLLHVVNDRCAVLGPDSYSSIQLRFWRSLTSFAVPTFFMLSGMFFLDPQRNVPRAKILMAVWRLAAAFVFWQFINIVLFQPTDHLIFRLISTSNYLWFLPALATCYAIVPALRPISRDKQAMATIVSVGIATVFVLNATSLIPSDQLRQWTPSRTRFSVISVPVFYFLFGDFLNRTTLKDTFRRFIPFFMIASFVSLFFVYLYWFAIRGYHDVNFALDASNITVLAYSASLFLLFREFVTSDSCVGILFCRQVSKLAPLTFSAYLVHRPIIAELEQIRGMEAMPVLLLSMLVFFLSILVAAVFRAAWKRCIFLV